MSWDTAVLSKHNTVFGVRGNNYLVRAQEASGLIWRYMDHLSPSPKSIMHGINCGRDIWIDVQTLSNFSLMPKSPRLCSLAVNPQTDLWNIVKCVVISLASKQLITNCRIKNPASAKMRNTSIFHWWRCTLINIYIVKGNISKCHSQRITSSFIGVNVAFPVVTNRAIIIFKEN